MRSGSNRGRRLVIATRNDLTMDNRSLKMARSMRAAGWNVTRVGLMTQSDQPAFEEGAGHIVRLRTTRRFAAELAPPNAGTSQDTSQSVQPRASARGAIRDGIGRLRDCFVYFRDVTGREPSVVVVQNADLGPLVLMLRLARIPVIFDVRDLWTEIDVRAHWLYKMLFGLYERIGWRLSDGRVVVNRYIGEELVRRYGARDFEPVHNGPDTCSAPVHSVGDPVRLFFQGAYTVDRDLDVLIRAMSPVRDRAHLTMQGFGPMESVLRELVNELALADAVKFLDPCSPSRVVDSARDYDIGIVTNRPVSLNLLYSSPNKFFDYLGGGLAVAVADVPFMANVVRRFDCGVVLDMSLPEALSEGLADLLESPDRVVEMKANAAAACAEFAWEGQVISLCALCEELTRSSAPGAR